MRMKGILALSGVAAALLAGVVAFWLRSPVGGLEQPQFQPVAAFEPAELSPPPTPIEPAARPRPKAPVANASAVAQPPPEEPPAPVNKAERLAQLRETFRALAAGDPKTALRAAKQLTDETERETALLALVTEWRHGELDPPRQRAWAVANFGLEAGLGVELAHNPELAVLWADELTEGQSRAVVLERAALALLGTDPAGALALSEHLAAGDRAQFVDSVLGGWAQKDTDAALQYAQQLPDASERDAAIKAIQNVAPVGIGAELRVQDGYPVINRLLPGTPAELGGQLHPGDRIVGMAQGNNSFVDARGLALSDVVQAIRGAPGTLLQLQVLPADAPPDASPRTVAVVRGQIKFKQ
jgi:PDZ domain